MKGCDIKIKPTQFTRWLFAAVFLSGSLFCPSVWALEAFSFTTLSRGTESDLTKISGNIETDLEIEISEETGSEDVPGGSREFCAETELNIFIDEFDLVTGERLPKIDIALTMTVDRDSHPGTGAPVVTKICEGPTFLGTPLPVECPAHWINLTDRSAHVMGIFPAIVTTTDPLGEEQKRKTTAQVDLVVRGSFPGGEWGKSRVIENRVVVIEGDAEGEDGEVEREHFVEFFGPLPGSANLSGQGFSIEYENGVISGSILVEGREYLLDDFEQPEEAEWQTEKLHFLLTQFSPCGDGICDPASGFCRPFPPENNENCPVDCFCDNGTCDADETPGSCFQDCGFCGDGICDPFNPRNPEDGLNCGQDCERCGDGICSPDVETVEECPEDCNCGNGTCDQWNGEFPGNCLEDCGFCGDRICDPSDDPPEDMLSCPFDCAICGDAVCTPFSETQFECPQDCNCGNGTCDWWGAETKDDCPTECFCGDGLCN